MVRPTVLAVDDDPVQLDMIRTAAEKLEFPSIDVVLASNVTEATEVLEARAVDMVITDQRMPDGSAHDIVSRSIAVNPLVPIVVITAFESVEDAVNLLKQGARDYIVKPLRPADIQKLLINMLEWHERESEVEAFQSAEAVPGPPQTGQSASVAMKEALTLAARAAGSDVSVLLRGESGTGKEVMARRIHANSARATGPFIAVNVAAIPATLVEAELFGHAKGAFTGATADRVGFFERAGGGTLFIDELGDIPLNVQVKLLRVTQFREIHPLGHEKPRTLDVRIITATNRDLDAMVTSGEFREDLYYRLNVVTIEIPPLRERKQDIPLLVEEFVRRFAERNKRSLSGISQRALNTLIRYDFPGNIRELENIMERAVVLTPGPMITERDLPNFVAGTGNGDAPGTSLDAQVQALERKLILEALKSTEGHQSRAASILQITERRLRSRMERLGIDNPF